MIHWDNKEESSCQSCHVPSHWGEVLVGFPCGWPGAEGCQALWPKRTPTTLSVTPAHSSLLERAGKIPLDKYFCFVVEVVGHSLQTGTRWMRSCASSHRAELGTGTAGIHGSLESGMQERCSGSHCPSHGSMSRACAPMGFSVSPSWIVWRTRKDNY